MLDYFKRCWSLLSVELIIAGVCTSAYMIANPPRLNISNNMCKKYSSKICSESSCNESIKAEIETESASYIYICNIIESVTPAILSLIIGPWIDVHGRYHSKFANGVSLGI